MQEQRLEELVGLVAVLEPLRTVFDELCEYLPKPKVSLIVEDQALEGSSHLQETTYTMYRDATRREYVAGDASLPHGTPARLRNAYLKTNLCDLSLFAFFPHVANVLGQVDAQVDWLLLEMQPLLRLRFHDGMLPDQAFHSVFIITTSSGEQFIADFTIEQFGYPSRCWLTPKWDYLDEFSVDGTLSIVTDEYINSVRLSVSPIHSVSIFLLIVDYVHNGFDWERYSQLDEPDRLPWILALVHDARRRIGAM